MKVQLDGLKLHWCNSMLKEKNDTDNNNLITETVAIS